MSGPGSEWARQRGRAIAAHAAELARREIADAEQARTMLLEFVRAARDRGIPPTPLSARSHDGRHRYRYRYRTGLRGWYLRADQGLAVDEDGLFYILSVPGSLRARLRGVRVPPARPRTIIGEGGRDGDRVALRTLLDRLLSG